MRSIWRPVGAAVLALMAGGCVAETDSEAALDEEETDSAPAALDAHDGRPGGGPVAGVEVVPSPRRVTPRSTPGSTRRNWVHIWYASGSETKTPPLRGGGFLSGIE